MRDLDWCIDPEGRGGTPFAWWHRRHFFAAQKALHFERGEMRAILHAQRE
jgi:hypothetical protein